jgi:hypothetical protein
MYSLNINPKKKYRKWLALFAEIRKYAIQRGLSTGYNFKGNHTFKFLRDISQCAE